MNYAKILKCDFQNGDGVGVTLFVQGCNRAHNGNPCKGCFNSETWNPEGGKPFTASTNSRVIELACPSYISRLSILGGEPLDIERIDTLTSLCREFKNAYPAKQIWVWTGYIYEDIILNDKIKAMLKYVDVIVDGPFIEEKKSVKSRWSGSTNQRVIDVKRSMESNSTVLC